MQPPRPLQLPPHPRGPQAQADQGRLRPQDRPLQDDAERRQRPPLPVPPADVPGGRGAARPQALPPGVRVGDAGGDLVLGAHQGRPRHDLDPQHRVRAEERRVQVDRGGREDPVRAPHQRRVRRLQAH